MAPGSRNSEKSQGFETGGPIRQGLIFLLNIVAMGLTAPLGAAANLERRVSARAEGSFLFGAQLLAGVPGYFGVYLRRAFYRWTLAECSLRCFIGYGAYFTHRYAEVADHVYIGPYALVGCARLDEWCLIGSRTSLLSRGSMHALDEDGRWLPSDYTRLEQIHVGTHAWVGEGVLLMADVGRGAMIAAGAVVSSPVAAGVMVAGNPARFVRTLETPPAAEACL